VDQVGEALAMPSGARPAVVAAGDAPVQVWLDAERQGPALAALESALLPLIDALPVKVLVRRA